MGMPGCVTRSQQNFQTTGCSIIVLGLRDLGFIRLDPAKNFGTFLCQRLNDQWFGHADIENDIESSIQPETWCVCYLRVRFKTI